MKFTFYTAVICTRDDQKVKGMNFLQYLKSLNISCTFSSMFVVQLRLDLECINNKLLLHPCPNCNIQDYN